MNQTHSRSMLRSSTIHRLGGALTRAALACTAIGGAALASSALAACAEPAPEPESTAIAPAALLPDPHPLPVKQLYLTFTSHNEEDSAVDYRDAAAYADARTQLVSVVNLMHGRGVAYNWQSDSLFMRGVLAHEDEYAGEPTYPLLSWMVEQGVEINPHHHEDPDGFFNYADVAHMFVRAHAVGWSNIVGGFNYGDDYWRTYKSGITDHDGYPWYPEILWGTSRDGSHGSTLYVSGLWRPTSTVPGPTEDPLLKFMTHSADPTDLPFVPGGCIVVLPEASDSAGWSALVGQIRAFYDQIHAGEMWNLRLMMNERDFDESSDSAYLLRLDALINGINAEFPPALRRITWANPTALVHAWETVYGASDQSKVMGLDRDFVCPGGLGVE